MQAVRPHTKSFRKVKSFLCKTCSQDKTTVINYLVHNVQRKADLFSPWSVQQLPLCLGKSTGESKYALDRRTIPTTCGSHRHTQLQLCLDPINSCVIMHILSKCYHPSLGQNSCPIMTIEISVSCLAKERSKRVKSHLKLNLSTASIIMQMHIGFCYYK